MERRGDQNDRTYGMELKQRRNFKLQMEFYDEDADVNEWSAHQYIFEAKTSSAPPAAPPAPTGPAAGGVVAPPPPALQADPAPGAVAEAAPPLQGPAPPAVEVAPPAHPAAQE